MIHKPIQIKDISLIYSPKTCFEALNSRIHYGYRIAIIGRNRVGKSILFKIPQGTSIPINGEIKMSSSVSMGYLPQIIEDFPALSDEQLEVNDHE